jgi:hypothetical protein
MQKEKQTWSGHWMHKATKETLATKQTKKTKKADINETLYRRRGEKKKQNAR